MTGYITKPPGEVNSSLIEFLPELESEYSEYPMTHERWFQPNEKGPKGEPCFVAATTTTEVEEETTVKKDYTFCKTGPNGTGYYSLLCRVSYINLYNRIGSVAPAGCGGGCPCFASKANREEHDRYDDCKRVIFMRSVCSVPNDKKASNHVINSATAMSNAPM